MPKKRILLSALFNQRSVLDRLVTEAWYGGRDLIDAPGEGHKILVLWGGEDIATTIYGQTPCTRVNAHSPSYRDRIEMELAKEAMKQNIPIIGICRGAQMMCALSGGTLVQHVDGHFGDHLIATKDGQEYTTSSIHHQMMNLSNVEHELIAWAAPKRATVYLGEHDQQIQECHTSTFKEPEIAWLPKSKALCIQGHPEYMKIDSPFCKYVSGLIEHYIYPLHT